MKYDMNLGTLADGTDPSTFGTEIKYDDDPNRYETLVDRISAAADRVLVAWFAFGGYGNLAPSDEERRSEWGLPPECAALVEWNDGNGNDNRSMLVMLNTDELTRIRADNECVAVGEIVRHYETAGDDGHPAYHLYGIHDRYRRHQRGERPD